MIRTCIRAVAIAVVILPGVLVPTSARVAALPSMAGSPAWQPRWGVLQEAHRPPVEVTVHARKYSFTPARIEVDQDDIVIITLTADDVPHSFTIDKPYLIAKRAAPGQAVRFQFRADKAGTFTYYCNITTDERCKEMKGELVVKAKH